MKVSPFSYGARIAAAFFSATITIDVAAATTLLAYWHGSRSINWSDGIAGGKSNWSTQPPPNGVPQGVPTGTAIFTDGTPGIVKTNKLNTFIGNVRFSGSQTQYAFTFPSQTSLVIQNSFINTSSKTPVFNIDGGHLTLLHKTRLSATDVAISVDVSVGQNGSLSFGDQSKGGSARVLTSPSSHVLFADDSSADAMTLENGFDGRVEFHNHSSGGHANLTNDDGGAVIFFGSGPKGDRQIPFGSISNAGDMVLNTAILRPSETFTATATSSLATQLTSIGLGRIMAGGAVTLAGDLEVRAGADAVPSTYPLINAKGGVTGTFFSVTLKGRPDLKADLVYGPTSVSLLVTTK